MKSSPSPRGGLCRLDDLEDPGSLGFSVSTSGGLMEILVVRKGNQVYGYLNNCPHTGGPLDWITGRFLDLYRQYIQCATHAALFRISDGVCVYGPCAGDRLTPVPMAIEAGEVILLAGDAVASTSRGTPDCPCG
jgi:nitrite reductase/ring-hydroxylating ferredoxin subunit